MFATASKTTAIILSQRFILLLSLIFRYYYYFYCCPPQQLGVVFAFAPQQYYCHYCSSSFDYHHQLPLEVISKNNINNKRGCHRSSPFSSSSLKKKNDDEEISFHPISLSNIIGQESSSSSSLSHLLSSPERFANQLNMTLAEVEAKKKEHEMGLHRLHQDLSSCEGKDKHNLICQHRYTYGKSPFVCKDCWSYLPICFCNDKENKIRNEKEGKPKSTRAVVERVIIWMHHNEWGSVSNTGSILKVLLNRTNTSPKVDLLMKGYIPHDEQFEKILNDDTSFKVLLWTDNNNNEGEPQKRSKHYTVNELLSLAHVTDDKRAFHSNFSQSYNIHNNDDNINAITLIVVDGTWRNARRMAAKLSFLPRLSLTSPDDMMFFWQQKQQDKEDMNHDYTSNDGGTTSSLLAPLRSQGDGSNESNLCTAEAIAAALVGLGTISKENGIYLLKMIRNKVNLTRRYQGKELEMK